MQPSARQQELERLYNSRRGHVPHISISDDDHHITEAIGSYYGTSPDEKRDPRPLSFITSPQEMYEAQQRREEQQTSPTSSRRHGNYFDVSRASPPGRANSNEGRLGPGGDSGSISPHSVKRMGSISGDSMNVNGQASPPPLSRQTSSETAVQQFPLNDIDYESSPAAVAQELSNLQAIRRMSMNVDMADPDLPSFGGSFNTVPTLAPDSTDEDDPSNLFWVPARLHPELAPKEFKTFVEDRVQKIRRGSADDGGGLSPDGLERSGSGSSSLRRKKSMLSHQIDTKGNYRDGAERLERKRSKGMQVEGQTTVANLSELEELVNDPAQLIRRMSLDTVRKSQDSGIEVPPTEDMPILPPNSQSLKRSTRTNYRRGSLRKGERVPFSRRALGRQADSTDTDESPVQSPIATSPEEPFHGLSRVQTEPTPMHPNKAREDDAHQAKAGAQSKRRGGLLGSNKSSDDLAAAAERILAPPKPQAPQQPPPQQHREEDQQQQSQRQQQGPAPRQFHSRIASSGSGRTTAHLPGYNNTNPLPQVIETLPDGTKVPVGPLAAQGQPQYPERKSSHEMTRPMQRGGAHMRPVPGQQHKPPASTLDDISSHPSPLPGSGSTRTDALTMVPTFEERKPERKDSGRKSSWKWILGNDDEDKEKKHKKDVSDDGASAKSAKSGKLSKTNDKARLDVLQNSIDGTVPARGRESLVLNREDIKLEDERRKESSKKSSESTRKDKDSKEPGLLSAIFGGKKKTSDTDLKEKKRRSDRAYSPEPVTRILKPDIDYNWTRFSILEERAIYRMAHIKLANPRRALYSQVLLSNFMYSYLAKVQMMHPQMQIPASVAQQQQQKRQREAEKKERGREREREQQQQQPKEYSQYQRYQEQQSRHGSSANSAGHQQQQHGHPSHDTASGSSRPSQDFDGYDHRTSEEMIQRDDSSEWPDYRSSSQPQQQQSHPSASAPKSNGIGHAVSTNSPSDGYSVATTHDYLGYPRDQQPFEQEGLWDDEKQEDLW